MGYPAPDLYHQPEHFGLTPIAELEDPHACYSFDTLMVWRHEDGRIFYAIDSGCSCPSPFEDFTTLESATPVTLDNWGEFFDAVAKHCPRESWEDSDQLAAERTAAVSKVSALLRAAAR